MITTTAAGTYYSISLSILFLLFIISIACSLYRNRRSVKLYSILLQEDGRISKISVAFLLIMPIIVYQAIYLNAFTPGIETILLTIFGTELGFKFTDKLPEILSSKKPKKKESINQENTTK